jgi:selenocysteine-specific elongation factor
MRSKRRRYIHEEGLSLGGERAFSSLERYFKANPLRVHCELKHLVNLAHMDEEVVQMAAEKLAAEGRIEISGGKLGLPGRQVRLSRDEEELASEIERIYLAERFSGPSYGDLVARLKGPQERVKKVFDFMIEKGDIVRIGDNTYIHLRGLDEAREAIRKHFQANSELSPSDMKALIGASRKFAIPLMEHFDREGLTARKGNVRVPAGRL